MSPHLDLEQLNELKEVLEDEFAVLVRTYLQDAELRLMHIQDAYRQRNSDSGRLASHSLKGASANLGAMQLSGICEKLEHACRSGNISQCGDLVVQIEQELGGVRQALLAEI